MLRKLSNARMYIEGVEAVGLCESFELPEVEYVQYEYKALGSVGIVQLPLSVGAMTATAVWKHQPPEISLLMHNPAFTSQILLRADQATFASQGNPIQGLYTATLRVRPMNMTGGTFEQGEQTQPETEFSVDYYSISVDGNLLLEIDAASNQGIRVNGDLVNLAGR